jgi:hypothetical protein
MSEEPILVAEKKEIPVLNGTHLEAALISRAGHHKKRILEKGEISSLPNGSLDERIVVSDKRFNKAYDLLRREDPTSIPEVESEATPEFLIAIADNLAWKGIERSLVSSHLREIGRVLFQLKVQGKANYGFALNLREAQKALKVTAIEDNHFFRDFFDSAGAAELGVDTPQAVARFLGRTSAYGRGDEAAYEAARGISLEIAARRYVEALMKNGGEEAIVNYGSLEEDDDGGDIVILRESGSITYIDLKNGMPENLEENEIREGYSLRIDPEKEIYKAIIWPNTKNAVAHDSFRLTDIALKNSLQKVVATVR